MCVWNKWVCSWSMLRCKVTCHGMASWQHPSLSPSGPRLLWRRGYQHQMPSAVVLLLCCWLDHLHAAANASVHCSAGQRCPSVAVHIGPHQTQVIPDTLLCTSKHITRMILIYFPSYWRLPPTFCRYWLNFYRFYRNWLNSYDTRVTSFHAVVSRGCFIPIVGRSNTVIHTADFWTSLIPIFVDIFDETFAHFNVLRWCRRPRSFWKPFW